MKNTRKQKGTTLKQVCAAIERIAPPALAEEWDNTGLLLAPSRSPRIHRLLLTIDTTPEVIDEAIKRKCEFILSYHPPLFTPVNRLTPANPSDRRLIRLLESRIAVYSPHTALDMVEGGVNDWLAAGIQRKDAASISAIPYGPGRLLTFEKGIAWKTLANRIRALLKVPYLRIARPSTPARSIRKVALCAGAGMDAMEGADADVYFTGEMKHHDILATTARGILVILAEHSHTERGYLPTLKKRLARELAGSVEILIAQSDRDPITLMR